MKLYEYPWKEVRFTSFRNDLHSLVDLPVDRIRVQVTEEEHKPLVPLQAIGIDPGINFGLAWTLRGSGHILALKMRLLRKDDKELPIIAHTVGKRLADWFTNIGGVIEGPAYSKMLGQVMLERIRTGLQIGHPLLEVMPPNKIRKLAFGSAKTDATYVWPLLGEHAADAVGCMLAYLGRE